MKTKFLHYPLLVCAFLLLYIVFTLFLHPSSVIEEGYHCRVMEVPDGYGYVVTVLPAGDTLIVQPYIPALGGYAPFHTKEEALKTGQLVCRKLSEGDNPTVSREEIQEILMRSELKNE